MSSRAWHPASRSPQQETPQASSSRSTGQVPSRLQHGSRYPALLPPIHLLPRHNNQHAPVHHASSYEVQSQHSTSYIIRTLYESFNVRDKSFFEFGRVFRAAPHERLGEYTQKDGEYVTPDCWGRLVISKTRICIVVEEHKDYCLVVTISSYGDRSLDKKSTNASEHSVARTDMDLSAPLKKDFRRASQMLQKPICIVPERVRNKLTELRVGSVVDFGKVTYIQHYHEIEPFGFVAPESLDTLQEHYIAVRTKSMAVKNDAASFMKTNQLNVSDASNSSQQESTTKSMAVENSQGPSILGALLDEQNASIHKYISNSIGAEEERDSDFRQRLPDFFAWGTVIRLMSYEEDPVCEASQITEVVAGESENGAPILRGILWLVIVQEGEESCKCLRITTYEGRGVSALPPDLSRGDHSIIYTGRHIPEESPSELPSNPRERQMGIPVRVRQFNRMEKLPPTARLLWTRVYDVKLDVKANAFGRISSGCQHVLESQFKRLNPTSPIDASRSKANKVGLMARPDRPRNPAGADVDQVIPGIAELHTFIEEGSDEDDISSSGSSQEIVDDDQKRMYDPGDAVVLLTGKDGPSSFASFRSFHIHTARLKRDEDGDLVWEYNLNFHHGGRFSGGRYFEEGQLMPAW